MEKNKKRRDFGYTLWEKRDLLLPRRSKGCFVSPHLKERIVSIKVSNYCFHIWSEKFGRPDRCQQFPLDLLLRQTLASKLTHLVAEPAEDSLPENWGSLQVFLPPHLISSSSSPPFEGANEAANLSKTPCKCWRLVSHFMRWLQLCLDSFNFKSNISAMRNIGIKYIWSKVKKLLESSNQKIRQSLRRDKASVNILHLVCHALWWLPKKHRKVNSLDDDCSCRLDQSIAFDMICIIFDDSDTLFKGLTDAWSQACLHNRMSPSNRSFPILPGFYTNPFPSCLSQWFQQRWSSLFKYLLETQRTKTKGFKSWFDAERCQRVAQAGAHPRPSDFYQVTQSCLWYDPTS